MLKYTGHPLIDVGVATIVAFARKSNPAEVAEEDLLKIADYLRDNLYVQLSTETGLYSQNRFKNFLMWIYPNSVFVNNLSRNPEEASQSIMEYVNETLYAFKRMQEPGTELCTFCGDPAIARVARSKIPLLTGAKYGNFSPQGQPGQPICGLCLLAIHAMPLGAIATTSRRLLVVDCDDAQMRLGFVHRALNQNQVSIHQMNLAEWQTLDYPKTRLIETLREIQVRRSSPSRHRSVVAYHFSNDNRGAKIDIFELPSNVVDFISEAEHDYYPERKRAWHHTIQSGWIEAKQSSRNAESIETNNTTTIRRNKLYDDLFNLPSKAVLFFKRYIWPTHSWELAELFLRKVMTMDPERLKLLYELGTRFAAYTLQRRSFYFEFGREKNYSTWRRNLLRAADDYARQYKELLITADEFVRAFTAPRDAEFNDWKLARDIVMLRIIEERLRRGEVLAEEEALVPENEQDETSSED